MVKKDFLYDKKEPDQKHTALSLDSWRQKQILSQLDSLGRIK